MSEISVDKLKTKAYEYFEKAEEAIGKFKAARPALFMVIVCALFVLVSGGVVYAAANAISNTLRVERVVVPAPIVPADSLSLQWRGSALNTTEWTAGTITQVTWGLGTVQKFTVKVNTISGEVEDVFLLVQTSQAFNVSAGLYGEALSSLGYCEDIGAYWYSIGDVSGLELFDFEVTPHTPTETYYLFKMYCVQDWVCDG